MFTNISKNDILSDMTDVKKHIQKSTDIRFIPSFKVHFKYFLRKLKQDSLQDHILCYIDSLDSLSVKSHIHLIALKKYYLHLEETQASHWLVKKKSKKVYIKNRKIQKEFYKYFNHCFYCQQELIEDNFQPLSKTVDHFIPLSKGGSGKVDNLRVCCGKCNVAKGNIHPELEPEKYQNFLKKVQADLSELV